MSEQIKEMEQEFLRLCKKNSGLHRSAGINLLGSRVQVHLRMVWRQRAEVIGILSSEVFHMSTSEEMAAYIASLSVEQQHLSEMTQKTLEECQKNYERNKKIPAKEFKEYVSYNPKAESVWEEAKSKADFSLFEPYLEKIVDYKKKFIGYWGMRENKYDTLLDMYEPGMTVDILDQVFGDLRESIVALLNQVAQSPNKPDTEFLYSHFPKENQREFQFGNLKTNGLRLCFRKAG